MIVETQLVGQTDVELVAPDVADELRAALGPHALELRRAIVRLRQEPGRHSCRIRALLREGGCLMIQKRSRSLDAAVSESIDALVRAVTLRTAQAAHLLPPRPGAGAARSLLFALPALGYPTGSLKSAAQLALRTGMILHVVRVLPARRAQPEGVANPLAGPTREAARRLRACRETRAWCDQVLTQPLPALRIAVRAGEFVSEIARRAHELRAELISMAPLEGRSGSIVAALARSAGVPVLVTRRPSTARSLLAASDLEDETYPILRRTAALASEETAEVLLFHDLHPPRQSQPATAQDSTSAAAARRVEVQRQRLLCAARRWLPGGRVVVTDENDPARAIVTQAAQSDVDTIVVGTRPHPWLARRMAQTVAARVVEAADRSVLVVPIESCARPDTAALG